VNDPSDTWQTAGSPRYNEMTGQYMINTFASRCATSIAHPRHATYTWFYTPPVAGWNDYDPSGSPVGFEIMSNGSFAGEFALNSILGNEWRDRMLAGQRIYATAGSDDHFLVKFGHHWTYVYVPPGTPLNRSTIADAIRNGRTIASTGPFLSISVGNTMIGGSITAAQGTDVDVTLVWKAPQKPLQIKLCVNGEIEFVDFSQATDVGTDGNIQYNLEKHITVRPGTHGFIYGIGTAGPKDTVYTSPIYIHP